MSQVSRFAAEMINPDGGDYVDPRADAIVGRDHMAGCCRGSIILLPWRHARLSSIRGHRMPAQFE